MNPNPQTENDDPLRQTLRQWVVDTPLPARFQERVWQRIARKETRPESNLSNALARLLEIVQPRPKLAFAYLMVLLAAGGVAGSMAAQRANNRFAASLGCRYTQSVGTFPLQSAPPRK